MAKPGSSSNYQNAKLSNLGKANANWMNSKLSNVLCGAEGTAGHFHDVRIKTGGHTGHTGAATSSNTATAGHGNYSQKVGGATFTFTEYSTKQTNLCDCKGRKMNGRYTVDINFNSGDHLTKKYIADRKQYLDHPVLSAYRADVVKQLTTTKIHLTGSVPEVHFEKGTPLDLDPKDYRNSQNSYEYLSKVHSDHIAALNASRTTTTGGTHGSKRMTRAKTMKTRKTRKTGMKRSMKTGMKR
jgi:hypothetical protein